VERLAEAPRPAPELLRALIAVVSDAVTRRHPHFCTMMLREVLAGGAHLEPVLVAHPARMLAAVQGIVARGVREGDFRPVDPVLTHLSLVGGLVFSSPRGDSRARARPAAARVKPPDAAAYVKHCRTCSPTGSGPGSRRTRGPRRRRRR
jgi:hypothetical protein